MSIYGVYDIKDKEQCIRVGTIAEIVKFLGISARHFDSVIKRHSLVDKRYQIYFLYIESEENEWIEKI